MSSASPTTSGLSTTPNLTSGTWHIDMLLGDVRWTLEASRAITFSLPSGTAYWASAGGASGQYGNADAYEPSAWSSLSSSQAANFKLALQAWADVANINFVQVADTASLVGDIRVAFTRTFSTPAVAGHAYLPTSNHPCGGDIWLNPANATNADFSPGTEGFTTLLHEIGHALGLIHPNNSPNDPAFTVQTTIMSYNDWPGDLFRDVIPVGGDYDFDYFYVTEETPSIYDIAAIQHLYGANTGYRSGNDTYTFNPLTPFFRTLWDGGGNDTLSVENFSESCAIDLREGHFCSIRIPSDPLPQGYSGGSVPTYYGVDNLGIAFGAVIENAIGGAGGDTLTGNNADNVLTGLGGNDVVNGGNGSDTAVYRGARGGYTITKWGDAEKTLTVAGADGSDTVKNVEYLRFDDQTLSVAALYASNAIEGGSGNDTLSGTAAADTVFGNNGNDRITGNAGNDAIDGGPGIDTAVYLSARSSYTIGVNGASITVTGSPAPPTAPTSSPTSSACSSPTGSSPSTSPPPATPDRPPSSSACSPPTP
jgi:Ca2+-binding RTX toxin-like protein